MVNYPSVVEWRGRLSSIVCLVLLLLAKLERGIDNYPLMFEDCGSERMSYLVAVISVTSS